MICFMVFKDSEAIFTECANASNVKLVCLLRTGNCAFIKCVRCDDDYKRSGGKHNNIPLR